MVCRRRDGFAQYLFRRRVGGRECTHLCLRSFGVGLERLGQSKIEQFRFPVGCDENIGRLDIAMDDEVSVRVCDRRTGLEKQYKPVLDAQSPLLTVVNERVALDVFHREVRLAVVAKSAVIKGRDVRVPEPGEDLPLPPKPLDDSAVGKRLTNDLQSDLHREFSVIALRKKDCAHPAAADLANDAVAAKMATRVSIARSHHFSRQVDGMGFDGRLAVGFGVKQRQYIIKKPLVTVAFFS